MLLTLCAGALAGVDAQGLQATDGGRYPALMEPDLGIENTLAASITMHFGSDLAVLRTADDDHVILDQVTTQDLQISMNVFDAARIGLALPRHKPVVLEGLRQDRSFAGDFAVFVQGPLITGERVNATLTAQLDLPLGSERVWLGDPDPALAAISALEVRNGRLTLLANLGPRVSRTVLIPGMRWGNHWVYGLGARWEPYGPIGLTSELFGRTPINPIGGPAGAYPLEVLATADFRLGPVTLGFGGGRGLTRGLGSPDTRFLGRVDVRPQRKVDRDGDGIGDVRDVCPLRAEDLDDFRDQDGCPDEDNDEDGLLDAVDACPVQAETFNGWRDRDGCPDAPAELEVVVLPDDRPDAVLAWQGQQRVVAPGRPVLLDMEAGLVEIVATAPGFLEARLVESVPEGTGATRILTLEPVPTATVRLVVTDPAGVPVLATLDGVDVPEAGLRIEREAGPWAGQILAPGFFPTAFERELEPGEHEVVEVLQPASLDAEVGFETDSAALTDEALVFLESLRAYLEAHPEAQLVRVEGQADDAGTSAYNYKLSTARAEAVRRWLVEHGVDEARLQAIGSGEAGTERRQVRFRVLIWD
ncbi:MAG: OmpA family protein [Myxococcota bacterium]